MTNAEILDEFWIIGQFVFLGFFSRCFWENTFKEMQFILKKDSSFCFYYLLRWSIFLVFFCEVFMNTYKVPFSETITEIFF